MTQITYKTNENGFGIKADGHAAYANSGPDIVCAAVSILMQTLLMRVMEVTIDYTYEIKQGYMYVSATGDHEVISAFETILIGLESLEAEYPRHVKVDAGGCPIIQETHVPI